jgi:hypothetical protein
MAGSQRDVLYSPKSRHSSARVARLLCAKSGRFLANAPHPFQGLDVFLGDFAPNTAGHFFPNVAEHAPLKLLAVEVDPRQRALAFVAGIRHLIPASVSLPGLTPSSPSESLAHARECREDRLTKKGELGPPASSPVSSCRFSLSSARDSLVSRLSERGECRAITNHPIINLLHCGNVTLPRCR